MKFCKYFSLTLFLVALFSFQAEVFASSSKSKKVELTYEEKQAMQNQLDSDISRIKSLIKNIRQKAINGGQLKLSKKDIQRNKDLISRYSKNSKIYENVMEKKFVPTDVQEQRAQSMRISGSDFSSSQQWISRIQSNTLSTLGFEINTFDTCKK